MTPDYPNGVYAYFTTLNTITDGSGPFKNFKRPHSHMLLETLFTQGENEFNYKKTSNQVDYDIQSDGWFRNTSTYNTNDKFSGYNFIFDSNKIKEQTIEITGVSLGSLSEVGIFTSGRNYRVNDTLVFEREQDGIENSVKLKFLTLKVKKLTR